MATHWTKSKVGRTDHVAGREWLIVKNYCGFTKSKSYNTASYFLVKGGMYLQQKQFKCPGQVKPGTISSFKLQT